MIKTWIQKGREGGIQQPIVFFEELINNPEKVVTGILRHLKLPLDKKRIDCAIKTEPMENKRKEIPLPEKLKIRRAFYRNSKLRLYLENEIQEINSMLKSTGRKERISYVLPTY
jgi:hypothetical protein